MAQGEASALAIMSEVGHGGGVALLDSGGESSRRDGPAPSSVAVPAQLAVPALNRQPNFDLDFGISCWRESRADAAERGQIREYIASLAAVSALKRARSDWLCQCNRSVLETELLQALAIRGRTRTDGEQESENREARDSSRHTSQHLTRLGQELLKRLNFLIPLT